MVTFDAKNVLALQQKLEEFSKQLPTETSLTKDELLSLSSLLDLIKETSRYHSSKVREDHFKLLAKLIGWPVASLFPVVDLLRLLVLHPHAAETLAHLQQTKKLDIFPVLLSSLHSKNNTTITVALRSISNLFKSKETRQLIVSAPEIILESLASCVNENSADVVNIAAATVLLNYSVLYLEQPNSEAKHQCFSILVEILKKNSKGSVDLLLRTVSAVGTCLWKDKGSVQMAQVLDLKAVLSTLDLQGNQNLSESTFSLSI